MEVEMFNSVAGPLLFSMVAGTWGFFQRREKRSALLHAMILLFALAALVHAYYPSASLFQLLVVNALVVTGLYGLFIRQVIGLRSSST